MKKILISALLVFGIVLSASAQGKKEMQESIDALQSGQTALNAKVDQMNTLLLTFTQTLATLQSENATLKERLAKLEADLAALRGQGAGVPAVSNKRPVVLKTAADSMQAVLIDYINSASPEEASQYVMDVQRVKPLMMKYYEEVKDWEQGAWEWDSDLEFNRIKKNVYGYSNGYIIKTPSGYKIDWEATVEYNPYTEAQMLAQPNKVFELRVDVGKSLSYVNDYWVRYTTYGEPWIDFYAKKTNPQAAKLDKWIKQETKSVIVKVKWVPGDDAHFELVEFVCEGYSKY